MITRITLMATAGDYRGREFVFTGRTRCQVGRSHDCSLQLPSSDLLASRHHCLLEIDGPDVLVCDLDSRNGTYVNGQRLGSRKREEALEPLPRRLAAGDELQVGLTVFRVSVEASPGADELRTAEASGQEPKHLLCCPVCF